MLAVPAVARLVFELTLHHLGEPLQRFRHPGRLALVRLGQPAQTLDGTGKLDRATGSQVSRQISFDEPRRAAVKQDVMRVNVKARHITAGVGPHRVAHERFRDDARLPRAAELDVSGTALALRVRLLTHDVAQLQPRHQIRIAELGLRRLENTQLNGVLKHRRSQRGQECRPFQRVESVTPPDEIQRGVAVLQHPVENVLLRPA